MTAGIVTVHTYVLVSLAGVLIRLRRRAKMVQDILSRHCAGDITLNDQERFVVDQLHVSCEIVYEAKVNKRLLRYPGVIYIMAYITGGKGNV